MKRYKKGIALMLALAMTLTPFGTAAGALLSAGESEAVPASERAAETEAASETDTAAETEVYEETETFTETEITRETEAATETAEDTETAEVSETAAETEEALLLDAAVNISGSFGSSRLKYTITGKTKENCTLTISGKGKWVMCDDPKNVEHNPWNDSSSEDYTITSVVLEEGVTGIDGFCSTMRLQDVKTLSLPSTVSILSDYFANNWSSIASVTVAGGNPDYSSYEGMLYDGSQEVLIFCPRRISKLVFSPKLKEISAYAFRSLEQRALTLPEGVEMIGYAAFQSSKVSQLDLPASLAEVNELAFLGSSIRRVNVAEGSKTCFTRGGALYTRSPQTLVFVPESDTPRPFFAAEGTKKIAMGALGRGISILGLPASLTECRASLTWPEKVYYAGSQTQWKSVSILQDFSPHKYDFKYLTAITLNTKQKTLKNGESFNLSVRAVTPAGADPIGYSYESSNPTVAGVNKAGKVTARASGSCQIRVTAHNNGVSAICTVTVKKTQTLTVTEVNYQPALRAINREYQDYVNTHAQNLTSYMTKSGSGYMIVQGHYDQHTSESRVLAEYYDSDFRFLRAKVIRGMLPIFGGFYESGDSYYLVTGQSNYACDDNVEVIRVVRFDKNWNYQSECGFYNCNISLPFNSGALRMTMKGDELLMHMSRLLYEDMNGVTHQTDLLLTVDTKTMSRAHTVEYQSSHSFTEFVRLDGDKVVLVNHGDANPRAVRVSVFNDLEDSFADAAYDPMTFARSNDPVWGYNYTGAALGGFEVSKNDYLISGISYDQATRKMPYNVFVLRVNKTGGAGKTIWLTDHTDSSLVVRNTQMVDMQDGTYLVLWTEEGKAAEVCYQRIGADGSPSGRIYRMKGHLSDCAPILTDGKILWYVTDQAEGPACEMTFYQINALSLSQNSASTHIRAPFDRIFGADRYGTSRAIADALAAQLGVKTFDAVVVASGASYADALAGSYLASVKQAPILLCDKNKVSQAVADAKKYLKKGGICYVLGGTAAVPAAFDSQMSGYKVQRLAGADRYGTNLEILKASGLAGGELLVCSGQSFADALSAASADRPVLLVGKSLTAAQKRYLTGAASKLKKIYVIGGTAAVSADVEAAVKKQTSAGLTRLAGANRFATSTAVAGQFYGDRADSVTLAYGMNFPDGLCGGPFACAAGGPLILMDKGNTSLAAAYISKARPSAIYVLGGSYVMPTETVLAMLE